MRHGGLRVNTLTLFVLVLRTGIDRATTIAVDDALAWLAADMAVQSPGNAFVGKARPKAAARRRRCSARPFRFPHSTTDALPERAAPELDLRR